MWQESEPRSPMICFLSMGSDPTENIEKLAKNKGIRKTNQNFQNIIYGKMFCLACRAVSMGQGQEVHARRLLSLCFNDGGWLLLQNCHLGLNYMDELLSNVNKQKTIKFLNTVYVIQFLAFS